MADDNPLGIRTPPSALARIRAEQEAREKQKQEKSAKEKPPPRRGKERK
jgi:hypothetical protein